MTCQFVEFRQLFVGQNIDNLENLLNFTGDFVDVVHSCQFIQKLLVTDSGFQLTSFGCKFTLIFVAVYIFTYNNVEG